MKPFRSHITEATQKVNATKFEGDMVKAFNARSSEGRERGDAEQYQNKSAETLANSCVKSLVAKMDGAPRLAFRMAGKAPRNVLTPAYTAGGAGKSVKSGEPKTDVVFITTREKYRCSVKYGAAAQIASAQTNEMWAVLNAVFIGSRGAPVARTISEIILQTGNEAVYKATRKRYEQMYGEDGFDALLSKVTGLKSGGVLPTKAEVEQMNKFLKVMGIHERLTLDVSEYMNKPENRKALLREFATGERRFNKPDFIATHFVEWFDNGTVKFADVDTFLTQTLPHFKFSLRDRGRKSSASGGGSRGIAFRLDKTGKALDESQFVEIRNQLNEGLSDWYAAAKNAIGRGWELIVGAVRSVVDFFARLLSSGFSALLSFLGLEPAEMYYTW
jgi:hypothetical protein